MAQPLPQISYTAPRTTPVHDRETHDVLLEAAPEHVYALISLIDGGDEDAMMLLLQMWAEHVYMGGVNETFVLAGTAMMPYVYTSIGFVLDTYWNAPESVAKTVAAIPPVPTVQMLPGEVRVEARSSTVDGHGKLVWAVRDDLRLLEVFDTQEEALEALERYKPPTEGLDRDQVIPAYGTPPPPQGGGTLPDVPPPPE